MIMDRCVYLKPGEVLHLLFKGRARVRWYETVRTIVTMEGRLILGKPRYLSAQEVRDLTRRGSGSMLEGFKARLAGKN
jgi:hypothetical protein